MTVQLYQGDCLDFMRILKAGSVEAVVADPQYGMAWDTDSTRFTGGDKPDIRRGAGRSDWGPIANDDKPFDPLPWLQFPKVVLWGANHYASKLPVGTTLVWIKKGDHLFGTFLSDAEIGWMKGGYGVYCFRKQFPPPCVMAEAGGRVAHPTQKPVSLMAWCIQRLRLPTGATIFDPYMGSGTTGVAAVQLGYSFIGCEIDPRYFETARKRIELAQQQPLLFQDAEQDAQPALLTA